MSVKNVFFIENKEIQKIDSLKKVINEIYPFFQVSKLDSVNLTYKQILFQAFTFDNLHENHGISQASMNSILLKNNYYTNDSIYDFLRTGLLEYYYQEHEALKIKLIIFYSILYFKINFIGVTSVTTYNNGYVYDFSDYNIIDIDVWKLTTNSLLDLQSNTILFVSKM